MRSGTALLAFGAGAARSPYRRSWCLSANANLRGVAFDDSAGGARGRTAFSEIALNHRNTVQFLKNSKICEGAEHQVPETPSFGKS
jgi:hypothetical protein